MVFLGRGRENGAHFTADGAVDFGATLFLAGRLNDTHLGMVTGGVYNVVLVGEAVIFVALVHRVAVLGASRRNNGNSEGVLGGQDLFGHGRIAVLAVQGLDAVLVMSGLGSDDTLIPDMTSTTVGVGHGMGSIALAVHQHSARLGAGGLFQAFGVLGVPIMVTDSGHRHQHSFVAPLVAAVHPTLAFSHAIRSLDDFAKARVIVLMHLSNIFGLYCLANIAGEGLDASFGGCRLLGDDALIPLMLTCCRKVFHMLLIVAALTDIVYAARSAAGSGSSDFLVLMTQCRDDVVLEGLGGVFHALVHGIAVLRAGRSDHGLVIGVTQSWNALGVGITTVVAGEGFDTVLGVGGLGGHNAVIVIVTGCGDDLGVGVVLIIQASEGLNTILGAGSSLGDNTVIVLMAQSRDFLSLSLIAAITGACIGLNTSCRTGCCRCNCTGVPGMPQCIRIIAFFGQSGILVADVDGIALLCAGRRYRIALMPGLLDYRDIFRVCSTAGSAGKGLRTLLVDGSRLCDLTGIVGVRQLCLVIALIGQTGDFVALIDGITLSGAGRSNNALNMIGLVERRDFLRARLIAFLALEGLDTGLGISSSLRDCTAIPAVSLCWNIAVIYRCPPPLPVLHPLQPKRS